MKRVVGAHALVSRLLRVTAYALVVSLGLGLVCARRAEAKATDSALLIGEQLLDFEGLEDGATHELSINGQAVRVTSARTTLALGAVLDRFQAACEEHADGMSRDLADLDASLRRAPNAEGHPGIGALRDERAGRGVIACFAAGQQVSVTQLGARLERFTRTYDLGDLGDLRYVAARAQPDGGTEIVASWTEGHVRLGEMFPARGDAAGSDPTFASRPGGGRRVLSARDARAPYGVFLYELDGDAARALTTYTRAARAAGWTIHEEVNERDRDVAAFERGGVDVLVTVLPRGDGLSLLSIVELPTLRAGKGSR